MDNKLHFDSDYTIWKVVHQRFWSDFQKSILKKNVGYGTDEYCESAKQKIRAPCGLPNAEVRFLVGGTQTNTIVISGILRSWQGVIAADTGHIAVHEAGAIEATGHKVITLPHNYALRHRKVQRRVLYWRNECWRIVRRGSCNF